MVLMSRKFSATSGLRSSGLRPLPNTQPCWGGPPGGKKIFSTTVSKAPSLPAGGVGGWIHLLAGATGRSSPIVFVSQRLEQACQSCIRPTDKYSWMI